MTYQDKNKDELIQELLFLKAENERLSSSIKVAFNNKEDILQSELRYERFFKDNHSIMVMVNPETGEIVDVNPSACQFYGWTRVELQKKNIAEINMLSAVEIKAEMQKALTDKRSQFFFKHRLANGEIRDVEVYSGPIKFGEKTLLYSIIHDISERKKAETELLKSEEKYRLITEKISDVVWLMDFKGNSTFVSQSIERFTGYTVEEYLQQSIQERFTPESAKIAERTLKEELSKQFNVDDFKRYSVTLELDYICKDGNIKTGELLITPILDVNGEFTGIHGVSRDITERKRIERELRQSEEKYRNIFETVQDAYYEATPNGILLDISPSIEFITGGLYTRDELIGKSFVGFYSNPVERESIYNQLVKCGKVIDYELSMQNKDGSIVQVAISTILIKDAVGNPLRITGSMRDISERKKNEKLLQESEALYQSILNASPDDITISDLDGKVLYVSPKALSMFGYENENQIVGRNLVEFVAPPSSWICSLYAKSIGLSPPSSWICSLYAKSIGLSLGSVIPVLVFFGFEIQQIIHFIQP